MNKQTFLLWLFKKVCPFSILLNESINRLDILLVLLHLPNYNVKDPLPPSSPQFPLFLGACCDSLISLLFEKTKAFANQGLKLMMKKIQTWDRASVEKLCWWKSFPQKGGGEGASFFTPERGEVERNEEKDLIILPYIFKVCYVLLIY